VAVVANLPPRFDGAVSANDGVLFVEKELVVFGGQIDELEVVAVAVSHFASGGGTLDWLGSRLQFFLRLFTRPRRAIEKDGVV
jgi:hypothetical protein